MTVVNGKIVGCTGITGTQIMKFVWIYMHQGGNYQKSAFKDKI